MLLCRRIKTNNCEKCHSWGKARERAEDEKPTLAEGPAGRRDRRGKLKAKGGLKSLINYKAIARLKGRIEAELRARDEVEPLKGRLEPLHRGKGTAEPGACETRSNVSTKTVKRAMRLIHELQGNKEETGRLPMPEWVWPTARAC